MKWADLTRIEEAPASGTVLAYTRKKVYFKNYDNLDQAAALLDGQELLEVHLFDAAREYRGLLSESRRFSTHVIEHVSDFAEVPGVGADYSVFSESVQVEGKFVTPDGIEVIKVMNKISFDKTGLGYVSDYRLKIGG